MRKSLTYKILAAVMALTAVNYALPANTMAGTVDDDKYVVESDGEIISSGTFTNVYGNGHSFTITGGKIDGKVFGAGNDNQDYDKDASGGDVTINGNADIAGAVYGGRSGKGEAYNNTVNISGASVTSNVYGIHRAVLITTLLTSAAALYQVMFTEAGQITVKLMTTPFTSAAAL